MTITEKNELLGELYQMEHNRIHPLVRMTPKKVKVLRILLIIFASIELLVFILLPKVLNIAYPDFHDRNVLFELMGGYLNGIIIGLIPLAIVVIYLAVICILDKEAYSTASRAAFNMCHQREELEKAEDRKIQMNSPLMK